MFLEPAYSSDEEDSVQEEKPPEQQAPDESADVVWTCLFSFFLQFCVIVALLAWDRVELKLVWSNHSFPVEKSVSQSCTIRWRVHNSGLKADRKTVKSTESTKN